MRIVKEGKIPEIEEKYKNCFNCNTEMAYTQDDIKLDIDYDKFITCPICNQKLHPSIFDRKVRK